MQIGKVFISAQSTVAARAKTKGTFFNVFLNINTFLDWLIWVSFYFF